MTSPPVYRHWTGTGPMIPEVTQTGTHPAPGQALPAGKCPGLDAAQPVATPEAGTGDDRHWGTEPAPTSDPGR
jgi:hypothetical protein